MKDEQTIPDSDDSNQEFRKKSREVFWGAMSGWVLDSFDLSMLFVLVPSMSIIFFPEGEANVAFVGTLSIYLIALIFRPLGGLIFGRMGDLAGRRLSMVISLSGLGIAVFMTGLLPTYASAGIMAPALLVLMRVLVGFFAGGEYGNSSVIVMESIPGKGRGKFGGLLQGGYPIGFTLVTLLFVVMRTFLSNQEFLDFGWRIMFFVGVIPAFFGVIIRYRMPESFLWTRLYGEGNIDRAPIRSLFSKKSFIYSFLVGVLMVTGIAWVYYLTIGFYPSAFQDYSGIAFPNYTFVIIAAILSSFVGYLISGTISDRIGRKRSIFMFAILAVIVAFPADYIIFKGIGGILLVGTLASILAFATTGIYGIVPSFLSEKFPTRIRGTAVGVSFNAGFIVGSWSSAMVLLLSTASNIWLIASVAIIVGEILIFIASILSEETYRVDLSEIQ